MMIIGLLSQEDQTGPGAVNKLLQTMGKGALNSVTTVEVHAIAPCLGALCWHGLESYSQFYLHGS